MTEQKMETGRLTPKTNSTMVERLYTGSVELDNEQCNDLREMLGLYQPRMVHETVQFPENAERR